MSGYVAKAAAVKVPVGAATGNRVAHILRAGDPIPEGVDAGVLKDLAKRGLIEKAPSARGRSGTKTETSSEGSDGSTDSAAAE